jgi:hypothetical protein
MAYGALSAAGALAAERNWTVAGNTLKIVTPCAKAVTIEPSATLSGQIEVSASADRKGEIERLEVEGGSVASIGIQDHRCKSGWPHLSLGLFHLGISTAPTLALTVKVPAGIAIDISEANVADYEIGPVGGQLMLDISGSGDVSADDAKDPIIHISGSGGAALEHVVGRVEAHLSGSGDLRIGHAEAASADLRDSGSGDIGVDEGDFSAVTARLSGSGSLSLGEGKIGSLTVASSGNSDVDVDATITDADLSVTGSGGIRLHQVTGQLKQSRHGSGSIEIESR